MTEEEIEQLKKELALFKSEALLAREMILFGHEEQIGWCEFKVDARYIAARKATDEALK